MMARFLALLIVVASCVWPVLSEEARRGLIGAMDRAAQAAKKALEVPRP